MNSHLHTGQAGESLAVQWLIRHEYEILHTNWRYSYYEIDIIARKGRTTHIIEVKTRHFNPHSFPEDSVTRRKFKRLQQAAYECLFQNPDVKWIQYDILSIVLHKNREPEIYLIEDVFL